MGHKPRALPGTSGHSWALNPVDQQKCRSWWAVSRTTDLPSWDCRQRLTAASSPCGGSVAVMPDYSPDPQVVPYLLYENAGAAMDWLIRVFGFTERVRDQLSDGTVRHGELVLDNGGVIMVGAPGADFRGPAKLGEITQLQCITITDLLPHRERAQAAGAGVSEISIRANRARSYTVDDPEGHRWYFSEPL
jgi:uncharacterized glyoxalase superfamily protein PhnB